MKVAVSRGLPWLGLLLLLILCVYGFYSGRLFSQAVWSQAGQRRLISLLVLYTAGFLAVTFCKRTLFVPLLVAAGLIYAAVSVGVLPLIAAAYLLFSSLILGRTIQALLRGGRPGTARAGGATEPVIALLLGLSVFLWLVGFLVRYPVNYRLTYVVLLGAPIVWRYRLAAAYVRGWIAGLGSHAVKGPLAQAALGMVGFLLLAHWLVVLKPEVSADGLAIHLAIPAAVADFHRFPFDPRHTVWAVMPMNGDWGFTAAFLVGGEYAARLFNFSLFLLAVALVARAVRPWLSAASTLLVVGLLASTPLVQLLSGSLMVENTWSVLLLGALLALCPHPQEGGRQGLLAAAVLCGTAVAAKFGALAFTAAMAPLAVLSLARMARAGERGCPKTAALAILLLAVSAAPPYVRAYWETGNPVFPFLNAVFRSPYFDSAASLVDRRFVTPLRWSTLYDVTFHTSRYLESQDGAMGFHYLLLLPLSILLWRRTWPPAAKAALWVSAASWLLVFPAQSNLRYLYPSLVMSMLPVGALLSQAKSLDRRLYQALYGAAALALAVNTYFLPASGWHHKDFFLNRLGDRGEVDRYIEESAPVRKLVEYVNARNSGAPVVFIESNQIAGTRARAYTNTWHNHAFVRRLATAGSAADCLAVMNELGVDYVIAPAGQSRIAIREVPLESFVRAFTAPVFRYGKYHVARVKHEAAGAARDRESSLEARLPVAAAGSYDDSSVHVFFSGPWVRDTQFEQTVNRTLTYTDQPGASFRVALEGSRIVYVYTRAFNRGIARLKIDGEDRGEVDLYSAATVWRARSAIEALPPGRHLLTVEVLDRKNPRSAGRYVDLDGFEIQ